MLSGVDPDPPRKRVLVFGRLGTWCCRRRGRVVVAWVVVLVGLGVLAGSVGPKFRTTFDLPNVESRQGFDLLSEQFDGMGAGDNGTIVFRSANGFSPREQAAVTTFLDKVGALRNTRVQDPFGPGGATQVSVRPGVEGTIAITEPKARSRITMAKATPSSSEEGALTLSNIWPPK